MNRIKEYRQKLGLSQEDLSRLTGIPRTTISSIESGKVIPSVDYAIKLAKAFGCGVERLFGEEDIVAFPGFDEGLFVSYPVGNRRVLIPISLSEGDKVPEGYYRRGTIEWFNREEVITYTLAGCDPSLRFLSKLIKEDIRLLVIKSPSLKALDLLKAGFVHVAGIHMGSFEDNLKIAKNILGKGYKVVKLFSWEEGIVLRKGLRRLKELKGRLWLAREEGSGARRIFEDLKVELGIENFKVVSGGHEGVIFGIGEGFGDVGISLRSLAKESGLEFISVKWEDYCLCYREEMEQDRSFLKLVELLGSKRYSHILNYIPGYEKRYLEEAIT
ncbi:MAG: substrate-binding domain-containing protein [Aquificaceae bacterium]